MSGKKILMTSWGGNNGTTTLVDSFQREIAKNETRIDVLTHEFLERKRDGTARVELRNKEENIWQGNFLEFLDLTEKNNYDIIDFYSYNFSEWELKKLKEVNKKAPIIVHVNQILAEVIYNESLKSKNQAQQDFHKRLETLPEEEKIKRIKEGFTSWPATKKQEALLSLADKLVFSTEDSRITVRRWYPETINKDNKEIMLPRGSDFYSYNEYESINSEAKKIKEQIGKDTKIIMYSGRIIPAKGIQEINLTFNKIKEKYPETRLILMGETYAEYGGETSVYSTINSNFIKDVTITDWISERKKVAAYLKAADVLLLPESNNFSMAALEAMMLKTPVIMNNDKGSSEIYINPELAYGIKSQDLETMNYWVNYLFENPERAKDNALRVQSVVQEKYNLESITQRTLAMYEEAIREKE